MRIDSWPMDRIMRLPDWCFGRRWPIGLHVNATEGNPAWDIAEIALPERCVLWEVVFFTPCIITTNDYFRLALGDKLPITVAQMNNLQPLMHGLGCEGAEPREMRYLGYAVNSIRMLRMPIESMSKRPILEVQPTTGATVRVNVVMVFSSIPREVTDWLSSAKAINL